jgi:hypothetical protein
MYIDYCNHYSNIYPKSKSSTMYVFFRARMRNYKASWERGFMNKFEFIKLITRQNDKVQETAKQMEGK